MKITLYLFIFLNSFISFGQQKDVALKIYLQDAYSGKSIKDAKVTIEGFELPEIIGKYNEQEGFYFFTETPKGYNTVMTYHKAYNEKGFQNKKKLPKQVKLTLHSPYRVRLDNKFYKEDGKKLIIEFKKEVVLNKNTEESNREIFENYIDRNFPELEFIQTNDFPNIIDNSILVKKRNNEAFRRFNDPTIKKIAEDQNIFCIYGLLLKTADLEKTYFLEDGTPCFMPKYEKYIDADYAINLYKNWDKSHHTQKQNIRYDTLKEYYYYLTKNNITSSKAILITNRKDSTHNDYLRNDFFTFSTYFKSDTLSISNDRIFIDLTKDRAFSQAKNIEQINSNYDVFDPYIIMSSIINNEKNSIVLFDHSDLKLFFKSNRGIINENTYNKKTMYKFKGIVSPFGTLDLIDYYKNLVNF